MADGGEAGPGESPETSGSSSGGMICDFCGERVPNVRRVAVDREYDRLATPHRELYACPACSERKDQERLGLVPPR